MPFPKSVTRTLPDGRKATVYPFHVSLEGLQSNLLCRELEDYDVIEKLMFVSAWTANVIVITHVVMSSHGHMAVLAPNMQQVKEMADTLKQRASMFIAKKYNEHNVLMRTSADIQLLDNEWYIRNTLAYIPRNVIELGQRPEDYLWCSHRAMFADRSQHNGVRSVAALTRREKEALFHTHADLSRVPWQLDLNGHLIPATCVDADYLEQAFNNDQAFYLKTIGGLNCAEMEQKLVTNLRRWRPDADFLPTVNEISSRWFQKLPHELSLEQKTRLVPYLYHSYKTSIPQLARCMRMDRSDVKSILRR